MTRDAVRVALGCLWLAHVALAAASADDRFIVPADDLPSAVVAGRDIWFTRNGAFVVAQAGRCLFDVGLSYIATGGKEWGQQIRRSDYGDTWELSKDGKSLVTRGTLFDFERVARFKFVQQTALIPGGVRVSYTVEPMKAGRLQEFGVTLHFPVAEAVKGTVEPWPAFVVAALPEKLRREVLLRAEGRGAVVNVAGKPLVEVAVAKGARWMFLDERQWQLNTFRLVGTSPSLLAALGRGKKGELAFDILLGETAAWQARVGAGACEIDRYGRASLWMKGRKLGGGGVRLGAEAVSWLHESAEAGAFEQVAERTDAWGAGGRALSGDRAIGYEIEGRAEGGAVTVKYRLQAAPDEPAPPPMEMAFVLPLAGLAGPPVMEGAEGAALAGSAQAADPTPSPAALVSYRDGSTLRLRSGRPWTLSSATVAGQDCAVLASPVAPVGGNAFEGVLTVSAAPPRPPRPPAEVKKP